MQSKFNANRRARWRAICAARVARRRRSDRAHDVLISGHFVDTLGACFGACLGRVRGVLRGAFLASCHADGVRGPGAGPVPSNYPRRAPAEGATPVGARTRGPRGVSLNGRKSIRRTRAVSSRLNTPTARAARRPCATLTRLPNRARARRASLPPRSCAYARMRHRVRGRSRTHPRAGRGETGPTLDTSHAFNTAPAHIDRHRHSRH